MAMHPLLLCMIVAVTLRSVTPCCSSQCLPLATGLTGFGPSLLVKAHPRAPATLLRHAPSRANPPPATGGLGGPRLAAGGLGVLCRPAACFELLDGICIPSTCSGAQEAAGSRARAEGELLFARSACSPLSGSPPKQSSPRSRLLCPQDAAGCGSSVRYSRRCCTLPEAVKHRCRAQPACLQPRYQNSPAASLPELSVTPSP